MELSRRCATASAPQAFQFSVKLHLELPSKTALEEPVLLLKIKHLCDGCVAGGTVWR